jgi:hypothetical protein
MLRLGVRVAVMDFEGVRVADALRVELLVAVGLGLGTKAQHAGRASVHAISSNCPPAFKATQS